MEEQNSPLPAGDAAPEKIAKIKNRHKVWLGILIVLVILLLAGAGYLWWQLKAVKASEQQLKKDRQQLQQQVHDLREQLLADSGGDEKKTCTYKPGTSFKDNIKAALDSKNTAAFATYTTNPVKYVLAASEYGGNVSPDEAATSLEYTHSATGPWDFNLPAATVAGYEDGDYTDYFGDNTLVGKASSGMVVAFEFNCDGSKISEIFVAPDEDLL